MARKFHAFFTHDWGKDAEGRDNHARVIRVCEALRERAGLSIWLDEDEMRGDVNQQMTDGIDDSACVVAFVTKRYIEKAGGKGPNGMNDNCKFEVSGATCSINSLCSAASPAHISPHCFCAWCPGCFCSLITHYGARV